MVDATALPAIGVMTFFSLTHDIKELADDVAKHLSICESEKVGL